MATDTAYKRLTGQDEAVDVEPMETGPTIRSEFSRLGLPGGKLIQNVATAVGGEGAASAGGEFLAAGGAAAAATAVGVLWAVGKAGDAAAEGIRFAGDTASHIAKNELYDGLTAAPRKIIAAVDSIPILGAALTAPVKPFLAIADATKQLTDAFLARAGELARYSGPIQSARAIANVRQIIADMKEANVLGQDLSRIVNAQSEISTSFQDVIMPIKEWLANELAGFLENISAVLQTYGPLMKEVASELAGYLGLIVDAVTTLAGAVPGGQVLLLLAYQARMVKALEDQLNKPQVNPLYQWHLDLGAKLKAATDFVVEKNNPKQAPGRAAAFNLQ